MHKRILALPCMLLCAPVLSADYIGIEAGAGIHWLDGSPALSLRLRREPNITLLTQPVFFEAFATSWDQGYDNTGIGGIFGIRPRWGRVHGVLGAGLTYLANTNAVSGTHGEFVTRLGAGYKTGDRDYTLVYTHYSNAKPLFHWDGPNAGYDFLMVQVSWAVR